MATQSQAEKHDESPADSEDADAPDALDDETATDEDADTSEDEPPEDEEEAAARAAKEAEEGEGDKPKDEEPSAAKALKDMTAEELSSQLSPEQQMRIAHKFANKTMAAARRAEKATGDVKASNDRLTGEVVTYKGFVDQLTNDPMVALRRLPNFTTLKDFVQRCVAGAPGFEPKPQDEIAALRRRLDERDAATRAREQAANAEASQTRVFEALGKEPERFDLVLTRLGRAELWDAIVAYTSKNGRCPNPKVFELADKIESELSKDISTTKKFAGPAQKGNTAAAKAQSAASKSGKPTGKPPTSTPAARANDKDETEDERDARINREMREAGELTE